MKNYKSLMDLTGHESGAIKFCNEIYILNWSSFDGIPRLLQNIWISDGVEFIAKKIKLDTDGYMAIRQHEKLLCEKISNSGFTSFEINCREIIVTVQNNWH